MVYRRKHNTRCGLPAVESFKVILAAELSFLRPATQYAVKHTPVALAIVIAV